VAALAFSYTAGIFHLFTHGFFKALLFLGAGSLIHAVHSNNMSDMGGLRKPMPVTFWTFLIGSAALAALPPLAGFWSKDEVLASSLGNAGYTGWLVTLLGAAGGLITAFYMTRVLWLVFAGEYRGHGHPHESPGSMKWPLVALAIPAVLVGFVNMPFEFAHPYGFAAWTMFSFEYFEGHPAEFNVLLATATTLLALAGVVAGTAIYRRREALERDPMLHLGLFTRVLENRYYLDRLYTDLIVRTLVRDKLAPAAVWFNDHVIDAVVNAAGRIAVGLGRVTYDNVDQRGIDGVVNGVGQAAGYTGSVLRLAQSGNVQLYAGGLFVGVFVLGVLFALA
jgi:NADH-quinone oxidoreductase subunit L